MEHLGFPRLMYRAGTVWELESGRYDVREVADAAECEAATADGWHLDQYAAKDVAEKAAPEGNEGDDETDVETKPPTRAELEAKAHELGITFRSNIGDKKLAALIAEKAAP